MWLLNNRQSSNQLPPSESEDGTANELDTSAGSELVTQDKQVLKKNLKEDKVDFQKIIDMYHDICISFPRVIKLSEARKKTIKARLKDYTIDDFEEMFRKAEDSDFLKGKNDRNWSANFDWMLKESNMVKILEGNYSKKGDAKKTYGEGYGTGDCNSTDYYKQFITSW